MAEHNVLNVTTDDLRAISRLVESNFHQKHAQPVVSPETVERVAILEAKSLSPSPAGPKDQRYNVRVMIFNSLLSPEAITMIRKRIDACLIRNQTWM